MLQVKVITVGSFRLGLKVKQLSKFVGVATMAFESVGLIC